MVDGYHYVLIPSYGNVDRLRTCLLSLQPAHRTDLRTLINYASEGLGHAEGFTVATNQLLRAAQAEGAESVFVVSDDTHMQTEDWATKILEYAKENPDVGAIMPMEIIPGKGFALLPHSGETRPLDSTEPEEIAYPMFAFVWIRGTALANVGLLDERFNPGYYDDYDYGIRLWQKGYRCVWLPTVCFMHERGVTMGKYHAGGVGNSAARFQAKYPWTYHGMDTKKLIVKLKEMAKSDKM